MNRALLAGVLLALSFGCVPATSDVASAQPKVGSASEMPIGPHGGKVVAYFDKVFLEVIVEASGKIFVYPYDTEGNLLDLRSPLLLRVKYVEVRFPPDGSFVAELNRDSSRGALFAVV